MCVCVCVCVCVRVYVAVMESDRKYVRFISTLENNKTIFKTLSVKDKGATEINVQLKGKKKESENESIKDVFFR